MKGKIFIDKDNRIGIVEDNLFGSFVEHVGRSVYNGIYEPAHETAEVNGFRQDVLECVREMKTSCVRYPGGNFVSAYNWKDGIGKKAERPVRLSLPWKELEPNQVGIDEMAKWAEIAGCELIMAVNMGTGTPKEAAELVEYCNFSNGSYWSDKRIENGWEKPYGYKHWCVGNEMDGGYQIGALSAEDYSKKANEAAKQMRIVDKDIKLIMCGSSSPFSPTFPEWDRTVLRNSYNHMDYLSVHAYYDYADKGNLEDFLASPNGFERHISTVRDLCDEVKSELKTDKTVMLAVDEWNVWHTEVGEKHTTPWSTGETLIENTYDMADALVVGGMLSVLINNCDRVKIGCLAQLVNVIAPILTRNGGEVIRQTTYYPMKLFAESKGMIALRQEVQLPKYKSPTHGESPYLYSSVCFGDKEGAYLMFFVNVSGEEYDLDLEFTELVVPNEHIVLTAGIHDKNTFEAPDAVVPKKMEVVKNVEKKFNVRLPAYSVNKVTFIRSLI